MFLPLLKEEGQGGGVHAVRVESAAINDAAGDAERSGIDEVRDAL